MPNDPVISIVDDDASIREATAKLVRLHGFDVEAFATAEEFLNSPRLPVTSCLITDVKMPGMSGLDLQRSLVAEGFRMPVIFVTAFPEEVSRHAVPHAGPTWVLAKPFAGRALVDYLGLALAGGLGEPH